MDWVGVAFLLVMEETDKIEFYCLSFFSNSNLTPIVAQTMRRMIGIDMLLFSLPINIAINSNIRETEYKTIIALFFIIKLSVELRLIGVKIRQLAEKKKGMGPFSNSVTSQSHIHRHRESMQVRFLPGESVRLSL